MAESHEDEIVATKEQPVIVDADGVTRQQRKISVGDAPAKRGRPRGRPQKLFKALNRINAKLFLHDGRTIGPCAEGVASAADFELPSLKDKLVKLA